MWSCLGQKNYHKNSSPPMTTSTDGGSAPSPSSVSAARTVGLASRKVVKHPFFLSMYSMCSIVAHPVSARQLNSRSADAFLDQVCQISVHVVDFKKINNNLFGWVGKSLGLC